VPRGIQPQKTARARNPLVTQSEEDDGTRRIPPSGWWRATTWSKPGKWSVGQLRQFESEGIVLLLARSLDSTNRVNRPARETRQRLSPRCAKRDGKSCVELHWWRVILDTVAQVFNLGFKKDYLTQG